MKSTVPRLALFAAFLLYAAQLLGATVSGYITDDAGEPLAFSSLAVAGTGQGTVANSAGFYSIELPGGDYTITCHHIGYKTVEKKLTVATSDLQLNFSLAVQELAMPEVVIRRGEDPANEIMRQAIKKRAFFDKQVDSFTVDVYIKSLVRSRAVPDRVLGQKVDRKALAQQGVDSAGRGILFLSESLTKVAFKEPGKLKLDVISSRQSGGGIGIGVPFFVNFYSNNVALFDGAASRGFVSPLADAAFHYYAFRYEGNFFEDGKMIDRVRVTPRRKNEPLFGGYIYIIDGEWRIHSLGLSTNKSYGLDVADTVRITQLHTALTADVWRTQSQVVYFAVRLFGFDLTGNFLNLYNNYNLAPRLPSSYFNRTLLRYDTAYDKRDSLYWASLRPVPLEPDERRDFAAKDSGQQLTGDAFFSERNIDSLRNAQEPVKPSGLFVRGITRHSYATTQYTTYRFEPLLTHVQFNTVEGLSLALAQSYNVHPRTGRDEYELASDTRYGFGNRHLNWFGTFTVRPTAEGYQRRSLQFSGGKRLMQFNRENPVDEFTNTVSTLIYHRNYEKVYEAWFGKAVYENKFDNGLQVKAGATYEDRIPVYNRTGYSLFYKDRTYTPNHPAELAGVPFNRHAAAVVHVTVTYQPGQHYIELPGQKMPVGSVFPTLEWQYARGIPGLFQSTANFDRWKFTVFDDANFKLFGFFKYRVSVGGFLSARHVDIPDFVHYNGNEAVFNPDYVNGFQLAPYYRYSHTEPFFSELHAEHHFNGFLTNKIPLFNKLKWYLVAGTNTLYIRPDFYYVEAFAGLENIFKLFRVDAVTATQPGQGRHFGVRIGFGGVIGNGIKRSR